MDNVDLTNFLNTLGSLSSTGLGIAGKDQAYSVLQNALNTIGPTQMGNFGLGGPGGSNSSFNLQTGTGGIDLGAFNPAYSGLAGVGSAGISGYNSNLIPGLTSTASGTLSPALSNLGAAYGQNNAFQTAAQTQAGSLNDTYNSIFNNTLANMRAQAAPGIQQQAYGLQNTLFGNGTADSTGAASGSLAAQNFGRGVAQGDASMQLAAQQAAQSGMANQAGIASTLSGAGTNLLTGALNNFGNTNQLISGLNTAGLNNSLAALQGAGVLNTMGLNQYNAGLQTSLAASQARNGSLFPYAVTASALSQQPNLANSIGMALGSQGGTLLNTLLGQNGLLSKIPGVSSFLNSVLGGDAGLSEVTPSVSPILSEMTPSVAPLLSEMTPSVAPVLSEVTPSVAPLLSEVTPSVAPIATAAPAAAPAAAPTASGGSLLGNVGGALGGAALAGGLLYGLGSLFDALDPIHQMTPQEMAALQPQQSPAEIAARQTEPLMTSAQYNPYAGIPPDQLQALGLLYGYA